MNALHRWFGIGEYDESASLSESPVTQKEPFSEQELEQVVEKLAKLVVGRGMGTAAIFMLEAGKPLTLVTSQFMIFLSPILRGAISPQEYDQVVYLLEDRERIENLILKIEELENQGHHE